MMNIPNTMSDNYPTFFSPQGEVLHKAERTAIIKAEMERKSQVVLDCEDLEGAANKNALIAEPDTWNVTDYGEATPLFYMSSLRAAFKAGAEWQAKHSDKQSSK